MSSGFRAWMFVIAVSLILEDFQYLLRIEVSPMERIEDFTKDCEEGESENSNHKEEEKKEEQKDEKDNDDPSVLLSVFLSLTKNDFREAYIFLSSGMTDLENPPPEV